MSLCNGDGNTLMPTKGQVTIIGLYGISGCGKTTLLKRLKEHLDFDQFSFYEGSEVISTMVPGGLEAFRSMAEEEKQKYRCSALESIHNACRENGKVAIVTGHFQFWRNGNAPNDIVWTEKDGSLYTHIMYLKTPAKVVHERCAKDASKKRVALSADELASWQAVELDGLRTRCHISSILLAVLDHPHVSYEYVRQLLLDFAVHDESHNERVVAQQVDQAVAAQFTHAKQLLIIDGDKTMCAQDTGALFWTEVFKRQGCVRRESPLKQLFGGPFGYSYRAFQQATLLHEEMTDNNAYEEICRQVAAETTIHPEFSSLLRLTRNMPTMGCVIISCGLRRVWELVLEAAGLLDVVAVIAGGRTRDGIVVTAATKAGVVSRLQSLHQKRVCAFGDSPLDLPMLRQADRAIVVVIDEAARSKSMEQELHQAIGQGSLCASQVLIPNTTRPRLDETTLPVVDMTRVDFVNQILAVESQQFHVPFYIAAEHVSKLLATPMRDARVCGVALQDAHRMAGWYLAVEHLPKIFGLATRPISHVLGHATDGFGVSDERKTTIIALMRGGDPMARGVHTAIPQASYMHFKTPADVKAEHIEQQSQVVVVDSVVNTGKAILECVAVVRTFAERIPIVVVAGVLQAQCLQRHSNMYTALLGYRGVSVVALRVSETKFVGSGGTDTGNRLFNTTHLL